MRRAIVVGVLTAFFVFISAVWAWNHFFSQPDPARFRQGEATRETPVEDTLGRSPSATSGCLFEGPNRLNTLEQREGHLGLTAEPVSVRVGLRRMPEARLPRDTLGGRLRSAFLEEVGPDAQLYLLYDNGIEVRQQRLGRRPDYRAQLAELHREEAAVPAAKNADTRLVRVGGAIGVGRDAAMDAVDSSCADPRLGELRFWDDGVETVVIGYGRRVPQLARLAESLP